MVIYRQDKGKGETMMKKVFKKKDAAEMMTRKIAEYFAQGYAVDYNHNSGSSGEKASITLVKGDDHIRIRMDEEWCLATINNGTALGDKVKGIEVSVKRYRSQYDDQVFWKNEGEEIETFKFYKLGKDWGDQDAYTDSLEEVKLGRQRALERLVNKRRSHVGNVFAPTSRIEKVLKNHKGYKRLKVNDVDEICRMHADLGKLEYVIHFKPELKKAPISISM